MQPFNMHFIEDLITTSAWRAGARLVRQDLGVSFTGASSRNQSTLMETDKQPRASTGNRDADKRLKELITIDSG